MLYLKVLYCLMVGSKPHKIATMSNTENASQLGSSPVVGTTLESSRNGQNPLKIKVFAAFYFQIAG
jgi:hypothetical protein